MFEYIENNLDEIMQNQDDVMYLRPYDIGNKRALFAVIREDQGIYRKVQITKEQSKMTFPFEPIYWICNGPLYFFLKDFISLNENSLAINTTHLEGFRSYKMDDKKYNIGIYALFSDGSATFITRESEKNYNKNGNLDLYYNLLKKNKDLNSRYEIYYCIDYYVSECNTIVISELKEKTQEKKISLSEEKSTTEKLGITKESFHQSYVDNNGFNTTMISSCDPDSAIEEFIENGSVKKLTKK